MLTLPFVIGQAAEKNLLKNVRPVNYAPELEVTYMAKTVATDRTMMSFRALALIVRFLKLLWMAHDFV